ncbi:uncharacterized protein LOC144945345 isoform X2 [Lampetra fluviatilis]
MNIDTLLEAARYVEWQDKQGARADKLEISLERDVEGRLSNGDHTPHVYTLMLPTGALLPTAAPPSPSSARRPTNGTCDAHTGGRAHAVSAVTGATAPPSTLHHHGASQSPGGAAVAAAAVAAAAAVSPPSASSTSDPSKLTPDYKRFAPTQPLSAGTNATPRSGPGGRAAQQQQQQANVATAGGMMAVTVSPSQPPLAETPAPIPAPVNARFANPGRVLLHHHQNHQQQQPTLLLPASTFKEPSLSAGSGSESPGRAFPQAAGPGSASPGQAGVTGQSAQPALLPPMAPSKVAQASADELFPADQKRRPGGRAHLKECFDALKKIIPSMEEKKTSNLTILRGALRYIQVLKRKEKEFEHEMERLAREKISSQQRLADLRNELGESLDSAHIESLLRQAMPRGPTPRPGHSNSRGATAAAAAAGTDDDEDDYAEDDDATSTASEGEENVDEELENSGPVLPSETPSWFQKTASPQNVPSQPLSQNAPMQPFSQNVKVQAFAQSAPWQALPHAAKGPAASQNTTVQIFAQHTALQAFPQGAPVQAPSQEPPGQTSQNAALQALAQHATVQTLSPRTTVQVLSQLGSPIQVACHPAPPTAPSGATPRKAPQATSPQPAAAAAPVRQVPAVGPGRHVGAQVPAAQHASVVQVVGGAAPPGSSQQPLRPPKLATVVGAPSQKPHAPTSQNHYHAVTVTTATARAVGPALSHAPTLHRSVAQHVLTLPHALVHDKAGVATTLSLAAAVPQRAVASGQTSVIQAPLGHALHVLRPVNPDAGGKPTPGLQVADIRAVSAAGPGSPATSHAVSGSPKAAAPLLIGQTGPLGHVTGAHILIGRPSAAVIHVAQPGVPQGVIGGVGSRGGPRLTRPRGGAPSSSAVTLEVAPKAPTLVHPLPAGAVATTTHIISLPVLIGQGSGAAGQLAAASVLVGRPGSLVEPHVTPAIASALADARAATANAADAKAPAGDVIPAVEQPEPAAATTAMETQRNVTPAGRAAPVLASTSASTSAPAAVPVTLPAPSPAPPPALPPHDAEAPK